MLLEIFLFTVFFCFYSCLIPKQTEEIEDSFENFIPSIQEAFSEEFDPIMETTEPIKEDTNSRPIIYLPAGKCRQHNQVAPINNPVLIVPFTSETSTNSVVNPESLTYQELKKLVRVHNLQTRVKSICNKPYNRCKKQELIEVLKA